MISIREVTASDPEVTHLCGPILSASEKIWVGHISGDLVAVWGVIPQSVLSDSGHLWSWAKPGRYRKTFIRASRQVVLGLLRDYPTLVGICSGDRHWLAWLGAEFGEAIEGYPTFTIRAKHG